MSSGRRPFSRPSRYIASAPWAAACGVLAATLFLSAAGHARAQSTPSRILQFPNPTASPVLLPGPASAPADAAALDLATYLDRESKLTDDDVEGRLALARWCRDRKMWNQAEDMANEALYRDPDNRRAYQMLQEVDNAHALPDDPAAAGALKNEFSREFSRDFSCRTTKHFLLCYDSTDAFAAREGAAMEKVYDAFQFYFNMDKLHPEFLQQRLNVVLFKNRDDYLVYGKKSEGADLSWTSGFYSQRTNRSSFFDDSTGPNVAGLDDQADALKDKIQALNEQIAIASGKNQLGLVNTLMVERNRAGEALAHLNNMIGNDVQMLNKVKTMHEAAHQIAFNMGIQSRAVDYPVWLSEGLACSFEMEDSLGHRGPALLNYGRIGTLKDAIADGVAATVADFVTNAPAPPANNKATAQLYAQGWGLFHFLYKFHREGMEKYLLAYKNHPPFRRIDADERKVIFTQAFGDDLDDLNKKFVNYFRSAPAKPQ